VLAYVFQQASVSFNPISVIVWFWRSWPPKIQFPPWKQARCELIWRILRSSSKSAKNDHPPTVEVLRSHLIDESTAVSHVCRKRGSTVGSRRVYFKRYSKYESDPPPHDTYEPTKFPLWGSIPWAARPGNGGVSWAMCFTEFSVRFRYFGFPVNLERVDHSSVSYSVMSIHGLATK